MSLVIDTCVLRAAGNTGKPLPSNCRKVLEEVRHCSVKVSVSEVLLEEWKKHRSTYSRAWLSSMFSRRLIERISSFSGRSSSVCNAVRKLPQPQRTIAEKDVHLVVIAVDRSYRIVSCELRCRAAFHAASSFCNEIKKVVWIIPTDSLACAVVSGRVSPPALWQLANPL